MNIIQIYRALDWGFALFHGGLTLFNLSGWAWKKTRRFHLLVSGVTLLSWFGLGMFYGWGFCPCTEWHWQIKAKLGETGLPYSYVKYYADKLTGLSLNPLIVDTTVVFLGFAAFTLSCWLNWRNRRSDR